MTLNTRLAGLALAGTPLMLSGCSGPLSTLDPAGPSAVTASWLWWGMFAFSTLVLIVVVALWIYAMRRDAGDETDEQAQRIQNRWIIGGGLILPLSSIALLLVFGIPAGHSMLPLPPDEGEAVRIDVHAHQWRWEVTYPDEDFSLQNEVHIPADTPIDVHLTSEDVIHSFWVPRLGGKVDAIPGHENVLRIQASEAGTYYGQCAEFCGRGHAHMDFTVTAHEPQEFENWMEEQQDNE